MQVQTILFRSFICMFSQNNLLQLIIEIPVGKMDPFKSKALSLYVL